MKLDNPYIKERIQKCRSIAKKNDWGEIEYQDNIGMLSFSKMYNGDNARMNIYVTNMTVATCLNHPKKGKTQIFLRNASFEDVKKIMLNPRQHTGRRYYQK